MLTWLLVMTGLHASPSTSNRVELTGVLDWPHGNLISGLCLGDCFPLLAPINGILLVGCAVSMQQAGNTIHILNLIKLK